MFLKVLFCRTPHLHGAVVGSLADEASKGGRIGAVLMGVPLGATVRTNGVCRWSGAVVSRVCFQCIAPEAHGQVKEFVLLYLSGCNESIEQSQSVSFCFVSLFSQFKFRLEHVRLVRRPVVSRKFRHFYDVHVVLVTEFSADVFF